MLQQLSWIQDNSVITSQSNDEIKPDSINMEVKRTLARYACSQLLLQGDEAAWDKFIAAQAPETALTFSRFVQLSALIQKLPEPFRHVLIATCFITKTRRAENAIKAVWPAGKALSTDSEQFITDLVSHQPDVLPICAMLTPEEQDLLRSAFPELAHGRHMLDMEGGYNTVSSIRQSIQTGAMNPEQFALWFARWILNVAGLDGHVKSQGSSYLTEPVAACMQALLTELNQLFTNPAHPVLDNYLAFRAEQLQVDNHYFAYLGAQMRQYSPSIGQEIKAWFESLPEDIQAARLESFKHQLHNTKVTPTYQPTILDNLLSSKSLKCSVSEALTLFSHIQQVATQGYNEGVEAGNIPESTPLCYRTVAYIEFLSPIVADWRKSGLLPKLEINDKAEVIYQAPVLLENVADQSYAASSSCPGQR